MPVTQTFCDNHDTGSTQAHWPFPHNAVGQGYAYILTHPGMPCIFYDHYFEWGDTLKNEIQTLLEVCRGGGGRGYGFSKGATV
jgi:alpha-amylase